MISDESQNGLKIGPKKCSKLDPENSIALLQDHLGIEGMNGARVYGLTSSM